MADITKNAMANLGRDDFALQKTLEKICETFGCTIEDVVEITSDQGE